MFKKNIRNLRLLCSRRFPVLLKLSIRSQKKSRRKDIKALQWPLTLFFFFLPFSLFFFRWRQHSPWPRLIRARKPCMSLTWGKMLLAGGCCTCPCVRRGQWSPCTTQRQVKHQSNKKCKIYGLGGKRGDVLGTTKNLKKDKWDQMVWGSKYGAARWLR